MSVNVMMIVMGGYKTRRKGSKDADHDVTVREATYTAGVRQTQLRGGKAQSGFISCGILKEGCCAHTQLMLRIKSQCTLRAAGATFLSDANREKLGGSNVALNGSVDHTVEKVSKNRSAHFTF